MCSSAIFACGKVSLRKKRPSPCRDGCFSIIIIFCLFFRRFLQKATGVLGVEPLNEVKSYSEEVKSVEKTPRFLRSFHITYSIFIITYNLV